jgi:hypothetical protein|nr:MAG TPA: Putative antitoxin of bacterial toxin-antitoxin system, YdaS/YdaT [Caudoviricetes sp.]
MNDTQLIEKLGGTNALSKHLGISYQRVHNWLTRGIPCKTKLQHPELFLCDDPPDLSKSPRVAEQSEG